MKIEGEILINWEYTPPRNKKILHSLLPIILIGAWLAFSFFFGKWTKHLSSVWMMLLMLFIGFTMKGFKAQKYQLTTRGAYVFDPNKKDWKRLGYWDEFIDYERGDGYIKLKKERLFGGKYIYFNKESGDLFKIIEVVNENIFAHRNV